ncbi:MAG: hypothetical protein JW918_19280 [Anaerolineae bacterium]|nr:hypothetical protein [Anaerolineae bacterium]
MLDWFILLAPLLLLPIALLFAFIGCTAATITVGEPAVRFSLSLAEELNPWTMRVVFRWTVNGSAEQIYTLRILDGVPEPPGDVVFEHQIDYPVDGEWSVQCDYYFQDAAGLETVAARGDGGCTFEHFHREDVRFRLMRGGSGRLEVRTERCPG